MIIAYSYMGELKVRGLAQLYWARKEKIPLHVFILELIFLKNMQQQKKHVATIGVYTHLR